LVGTAGKRPYSGPWDKIVAQVSNRFQPAVSQGFQPARRAHHLTRPKIRTVCRLEILEIGDTAGWKPALRRTGRPAILRIAGNLAREIRGIALQVTCTANL